MSTGRRASWLGQQFARMAGVAVVAAGMLIACSGARPGQSPSASLPRGSAAASVDGQPTDGPGQAFDLIGKTWLAEGPRGWEAGQIGGRRISLGSAETGVAASNRWILSAVFGRVRAIRLLIRDGPGGEPKTVDLGGLAPTAAAIVGDRAYVSGFSFARPNDPGVLEVDLPMATARALLQPSDAAGTRYLAVSPDGSTLVSSLCDVVTNPEPATCALSAMRLADGVATSLGVVPGGLLRGTSAEVAVVAPQGPEPPGWLAGIDLRTGRELWRVAGGEFGPSVMNQDLGLIQQRILIDGPKPRLVIEAIDLGSGASRVVYEETRGAVGALWPALCSPSHIAVGEDATGSRAIAAGADARTRVRLVPIKGGDPIDIEVSLRSEP